MYEGNFGCSDVGGMGKGGVACCKITCKIYFPGTCSGNHRCVGCVDKWILLIQSEYDLFTWLSWEWLCLMVLKDWLEVVHVW